MSQLSLFSPSHAKAIWPPSGEKVGDLADPRIEVSGTSWGGGSSIPRGRQRSQTTTARSNAPASAAASHQRRRRRAGACAAAGCESDCSLISWSSTLKSAMCWKRRSGSFCRQRRMTFSRSLGTPGVSSLGAFGCSRSTAASVSAVEFPAKARRPVTIS